MSPLWRSNTPSHFLKAEPHDAGEINDETDDGAENGDDHDKFDHQQQAEIYAFVHCVQGFYSHSPSSLLDWRFCSWLLVPLAAATIECSPAFQRPRGLVTDTNSHLTAKRYCHVCSTSNNQCPTSNDNVKCTSLLLRYFDDLNRSRNQCAPAS